MSRRRRLSRSSIVTATTFEKGDSAAPEQSKDWQLLRLAARMRAVEQTLQAATDEVAQAEQRLSSARKTRPLRPARYIAVVAKEKKAGATLEFFYRSIAQSSAHTRAGLAIKLQLAAMLYGDNLEGAGDDTDLVSQLLRSLITDVTGR